MTFVQARKQLEEAAEAMKNNQAQQGSGGALPVSAEACQWSEADLEVEHPKEKEKVAGIKTKKHIIRLRQSCTEPETKKTCDITWVMETWLARKVPAEKEARKFQAAYAEAMGMDELASQIQPLHEIIRALGYEPGKESSASSSDEDRRKILENLNRGEISSEEAMELLKEG